MKNKDTQKYMVILVIAMLVAGAGTFFALGGGSASTIDTQHVDDNGNAIGPWATKLVPLNMLTSDMFTGADVVATAKVYDEQPSDWGNARGTFDEAVDYTLYTSVDGVVNVNKEMPGMYYVVLTASGYNTEFLTIEIPDGTNMGDITDYKSQPDSVIAEMTQVGTATDEDFAITLVNDSSKTVKETLILTVDENTEFRGWKVIVNDEEGFSLDTDGDGTYDEGISSFKLSVAGVEETIFNPDLGVDEFDSNDEYTMSLDGVSLSDEADLVVKIEIDAITSDSVGANDEAWGEGEGVLSYIKIYDETGTIFATVDVTA